MGFETQERENGIEGKALNFSSLPSAADNQYEVFLVVTPQGDLWSDSYKQAGHYRSDGTKWVYLGAVVPQATRLDIANGSSTHVTRMSVQDVVDIADIHAPRLASMSLAERKCADGDRRQSDVTKRYTGGNRIKGYPQTQRLRI